MPLIAPLTFIEVAWQLKRFSVCGVKFTTLYFLCNFQVPQ